MGDCTLIVSNIHNQLTEEHLRKIFNAVSSAPKTIDVVAKDEEWYTARVCFPSTYVAGQAKEALHGKVVLERDLYVDFESPELKALLQKEYDDTNSKINKLQMSCDYFKKSIETERTKYKLEKSAQDEYHKLQMEKAQRDLELEKAKSEKSESEVAKLKIEILNEKDTNAALKKAKQLNAEEYYDIKNRLDVTVDGLKILKQVIQSQIPALKPPAKGFSYAYPEPKTTGYEALVELHKKIVDIIDKAESWETSTSSKKKE